MPIIHSGKVGGDVVSVDSIGDASYCGKGSTTKNVTKNQSQNDLCL